MKVDYLETLNLDMTKLDLGRSGYKIKDMYAGYLHLSIMLIKLCQGWFRKASKRTRRMEQGKGGGGGGGGETERERGTQRVEKMGMKWSCLPL